MIKKHRLTKVFLELEGLNTEEGLSLETLFNQLGHRGHAVLLVFFSLPFFLPIPVPGLSTILGVIMIGIAITWGMRKMPWLPRKWKSAQIPNNVAKKIFFYGLKISGVIERFVRPRGAFFFHFLPMRVFISLVISACAFFLALPLPPGTNFPPALTIFLFALSILEEDFLVLALGVLVLAGNFILFKTMATAAVHYIMTTF